MKGALRWFGKVLMREDVPWTPAQSRRAMRLASSQAAARGVGAGVREAMRLATEDRARGSSRLGPETIAAADKATAAGRGSEDPEARELLASWRSGLDALPTSWLLPDDGGASADLAVKANAVVRRFHVLDDAVVDSESDLLESYEIRRVQFGPPDLSMSIKDLLFSRVRGPDQLVADLQLEPGRLELFRTRRTSMTAVRDIHWHLTGSTIDAIPPTVISWGLYSVWAPTDDKSLTGQGQVTYETQSGSQPAITTITVKGGRPYRLE